ncbi:16S rRNA (guanine(966)-N(2))-methyltransferase RsmD [Glaciecola sp. 1036]|uniref:16S rRNA (guanine(966)-N(2))-methyltransferase RsmD n=1 Tax=Alteromonadaceae TaxID=72275 RepID=UPI003D02DA70
MPLSQRKSKRYNKFNSKPDSGHSKKSANASSKIRIISGSFKGRKIAVANADGLRPTTDRIRETLFNWLIGSIAEKRILDMYAGTGALGFEALSRGASHCTFFEINKMPFRQLIENADLLSVSNKCNFKNMDVLTILNESEHQFDLIFIDPPFGKNLVNPSISELIKADLLASNALIYVECENNYAIDDFENLMVIKTLETKTFTSRLYKYSKIS